MNIIFFLYLFKIKMWLFHRRPSKVLKIFTNRFLQINIRFRHFLLMTLEVAASLDLSVAISCIPVQCFFATENKVSTENKKNCTHDHEEMQYICDTHAQLQRATQLTRQNYSPRWLTSSCIRKIYSIFFLSSFSLYNYFFLCINSPHRVRNIKY